jgi:hypothetical protein
MSKGHSSINLAFDRIGSEKSGPQKSDYFVSTYTEVWKNIV